MVTALALMEWTGGPAARPAARRARTRRCRRSNRWSTSRSCGAARFGPKPRSPSPHGVGCPALRVDQAVEQVGLPPVVPRPRAHRYRARPTHPPDPRPRKHPEEAAQEPTPNHPLDQLGSVCPLGRVHAHVPSLAAPTLLAPRSSPFRPKRVGPLRHSSYATSPMNGSHDLRTGPALVGIPLVDCRHWLPRLDTAATSS